MLTQNDREFFLNLFDGILAHEQLKNELLEVSTGGDEIDQISLERERSLKLKLQGRNITFLRKISEAKSKLLKGEFGTCEECGADIGKTRLLARPTAHLCINCKEEEEKIELQRMKPIKNNVVALSAFKIQLQAEKEIESIKAVSVEEFEEAADF